MNTRESTCLLCPLGCSVAFRMKGEAVIGPEFCEDGAVPNSTRLCARGLYGTELLNHPQRVSTPLLRRDGMLREASWADAISSASRSLQMVLNEHGPEAVAVVTEPTRSTEELEAVGRFARSLGIEAVSCLFEPQDWPLVQGADSAGVSAIEESNCVIAFGDVFATHPVIAKQVIDAKYMARGNSLFVVDPRRSNTAWYASEHVQNRPGTEALLLAGMLKSLKASGTLADGAVPWLETVDEELIVQASGVSEDLLARMANAFSSADKAVIIVAPPVRGISDVGLVARLARECSRAAGERKECVLLPSGGNVQGARNVVLRENWKAASMLVDELVAGKYRAVVSIGADLLDAFPSSQLTDAVRSLDAYIPLSLFRGQGEQAASVVLAGASWLESDGSCTLFDEAELHWEAVGSPSWGTRTLTDVVAHLEASLQLDRRTSKTDSREGGDLQGFEIPESQFAARLEAIARDECSRASDDLALVAVHAPGHSGAAGITGWMSWAEEMFPAGFVEISSLDATAWGVVDGESMILVAGDAQVERCVRVTERLCHGVLAVPGYDPAARALFSWTPAGDGWFPTGPGKVRVYRKQ